MPRRPDIRDRRREVSREAPRIGRHRRTQRHSALSRAPEANDLTVGIMALVAEAEREAISRRTREALAAARARGVRLGNPNGAASLRRAGTGAVALRAAVSANAEGFAADLAAVVADIRAAGHGSLRAIAAELTARGIRTRRGGDWGVGNGKALLGLCPDLDSRKVMEKSHYVAIPDQM